MIGDDEGGDGDANGPRVNRLAIDVDVAVISFPIALAVKFKQLTGAEKQVGELILLGLSNHAIATRREVSVRTVANQTASIFRKLGIASRHELVTLVMPKAAD